MQLAREGRRSLFLTPDVAQVARALQRAAVAPDAAEVRAGHDAHALPLETADRRFDGDGQDKSAQLERLAMVQLRQCRDVFELLRVVAAVDASTSQVARAAVVSTLSHLLSRRAPHSAAPDRPGRRRSVRPLLRSVRDPKRAHARR